MVNRRHRKFTVTTEKNQEPLDFEIEFIHKGDENEEDTVEVESFDCNPQLQGAVILDFVASADGNSNEMAGKLLEFFDHALTEESAPRFQALIKDPKKIVDMELLSEIVAYLVESYTDRPTRASDQ